MGCYDIIKVPCPECSGDVEFQSKGGECDFNTYEGSNVPIDVAGDANRHPGYCDECGTAFEADMQTHVQVRARRKR